MSPDINALGESPAASTTLPLRRRSILGSDSPIAQQSPLHTSAAPLNGHDTPPSHVHSPPVSSSLAAAATLNAGLQNDEQRDPQGSLRGSQAFDRRRNSVRMSLSLNDPALPAPGEMVATSGSRGPRRGSLSQAPHSPSSPNRHIRAPSIGELHQELEAEQEAQVNRLLGQIRQQQAQIQALQSQHGTNGSSNAIDDSNPPSDTSRSQTPAQSSRRTISVSRHSSSARISHSPSPSLRPQYGSTSAASPHLINTSVGLPALSSDEIATSHGAYGSGLVPSSSAVSSSSLRDEATFYQAETQSLTRENQMLRQRIRELERQLHESSESSPVESHNPTPSSGLVSAPVIGAEGHAAEPGNTD